MPQAVIERAAETYGIEAEPCPVRKIHAVQSAERRIEKARQRVQFHRADATFGQRPDAVGGVAVREAEGLVHAGGKGGHTVREGRAWAWGPQTAKAPPYAALLALLEPSVAEPLRPRRGA